MNTYNPNDTNSAVNSLDFAPYDARIVYVKAIDSSLVPGLNEVPAGTTVYALCSANGMPLAVVGDRLAAFHVARQHNMEPVSVH